jgi:hypothetical protein
LWPARLQFNLAGAEGFEPPSSVLETDSLTVELTPLKAAVGDQLSAISLSVRRRLLSSHAPLTEHWSLTTVELLRFLMHMVLAAAVTELLELETAGGRLLVLRRGVITFLALSALQCDDFPHVFTPILSSQFVALC